MKLYKNDYCKNCSNIILYFDVIKSLHAYCSNCNYFNIIFKRKPFLFNRSQNIKNQYKYYLNILSKKTNFNKAWNRKKTYQIKKLLNKFKKKINILEISGGPGIDSRYFLNNFSSKVKRYDITEYDPQFVKKYNSFNFKNSECFKLDYDNKTRIEILKRKYEIIIISHSVYYCSDLEIINSYLKNSLSKDGYFFLISPSPNIGTVLRFAIMENYPPNKLWSLKTIREFFGKKKYKLLESKNFASYKIMNKYFRNFKTLKSCVMSFIGYLYFILFYFRFLKHFSFKKFFYGNDYFILFKKKN